MNEEKSGGSGGGGGGAQPPSEPRLRFKVELKPGETTIVSWKKLLKEHAAKNGGGGASSTSAPVAVQPAAPPNANPSLESRLAPGQPAENELKDGHPSRFGAVIEKIERLYMGKHSSDEEDLNDVPDDDQYDTEDSFIDDTELDDYFQVDNSAIKHDGFFVNRGKLERINEPESLPSQQPKKRRRKDLINNHGDDNGQLPNKLAKVGNKATEKSKKSVAKSVGLPHVVALPSVHNEEKKFQNQTNTPVGSSKKKSNESKTSSVANIDNKLNDGAETANASHDKSASTQNKSEPAVLLICNGELEKEGNRERLDLNVSAGKVPMQNSKSPVMQKKEGSSTKPKISNLDKTIGELEKMVAECRPPSMEAPDADVAAQAVKRRLPRELKQKLAKVARLAQSTHGRITEELINRLMSILGHLVQERTLKRNLKDMVAMGLLAKKEKDDRVLQMKKDVAELIRIRVPYIKSKVLEKQAGGSDDFQEMSNEEKEIIKRKYGMDNTIEDKICELYDLYVDGLDEEAGPQARRLYAELAQLWPDGLMDNHGIKRAVCRAKDRKRALYGRSKDQEKIKPKKLVPKTEGTATVDSNTISQPQPIQAKPVSQSTNHGLTLTSANKTVPKLPNPDYSKQDKVKAKVLPLNPKEKVPAEILMKKKVKKKPETQMVSGEKSKSQNKQAIGPLQKPNFSPPINLNNLS